MNQILIIEDNAINREKLKYLHSIRWKEVIDKCYKGAYLSKYSFCEYTNNKDNLLISFILWILKRLCDLNIL